MATVVSILDLLLLLYLIILIGRLIFDWVTAFNPEWRPKGILLIVAETCYTLTDPPLRALRKVIPPLRLGGISLDLGFAILIIGVQVARALLRALV